MGAIIDYENGLLDDEQTDEFFQFLLDSQTIYSLQGSYGRTANDLLAAGRIRWGASKRTDDELQGDPA